MKDITIYRKVAEIRLSNNFDAEGILKHLSSMGFLILDIPSKEGFTYGILKKEEKDA